MASINGDWFHSRSSSNLSELTTVRKLVLESQKPAYAGFGWSGGRSGNQTMYRFASIAGIEPSTMQTKIRAMIRYGFLRNGNTCPLVWTRMGSLWNDLYSIGNDEAAKQIYELTLAISLAIFAFNDTSAKYSMNPANGTMPLKFLFNNLDKNNALSLQAFEALVDGTKAGVARNISYWKKDLFNSGLFRQIGDTLTPTGNYSEFVNEVKEFNPDDSLTDSDWEQIRDNPLIDTSPFKTSLRTIFERITQQQNFEDRVVDELFTDPLIDVLSEQEESEIPEVDILSTQDRFATSIRRVRNATWSLRIKKKYNHMCAMPKCDVTGRIFVEAAHIKPDNLPDDAIPHRAHILNGICLCRHCHVAFDRGYFSLTDDYRVITSSWFEEIVDQNLKRIIVSSRDRAIKDRRDHRMPLVEFIQYHRLNKFKG